MTDRGWWFDLARDAWLDRIGLDGASFAIGSPRRPRGTGADLRSGMRRFHGPERAAHAAHDRVAPAGREAVEVVNERGSDGVNRWFDLARWAWVRRTFPGDVVTVQGASRPGTRADDRPAYVDGVRWFYGPDADQKAAHDFDEARP